VKLKFLALFATSLAVTTCAIAGTSTPSEPSATSNYVAKHLGDGTIEITVTGKTLAPTRSRTANLDLGDMLKTAAAKECPNGYDLSQDKAPAVQPPANGMLTAMLRGVARCK
jgi:hypothetical protein